MSDLFLMVAIYSAGILLCCFYEIMTEDRDNTKFIVPYLIGILATIIIIALERGG